MLPGCAVYSKQAYLRSHEYRSVCIPRNGSVAVLMSADNAWNKRRAAAALAGGRAEGGAALLSRGGSGGAGPARPLLGPGLQPGRRGARARAGTGLGPPLPGNAAGPARPGPAPPRLGAAAGRRGARACKGHRAGAAPAGPTGKRRGPGPGPSVCAWGSSEGCRKLELGRDRRGAGNHSAAASCLAQTERWNIFLYFPQKTSCLCLSGKLECFKGQNLVFISLTSAVSGFRKPTACALPWKYRFGSLRILISLSVSVFELGLFS